MSRIDNKNPRLNNTNKSKKPDTKNTANTIRLQDKTDKNHHVPKTHKTILSGGFAGLVSKTCTAPLERVQMLNQTGALRDTISQTLRKIFNADGFYGLWRGNFANCVRVFPHKSLLFTCNELLLPVFAPLGHSKQFVSGAISGFVATTFTYPVDMIRAHLAGTLDKRTNSMFVVGRSIVRQSGYRGLFTGWTVTVAGGIPYESLRIGCYGYMRAYLPLVETSYGMEPHPVAKMGCGAAAGAAAGIGTYPTDTIRRMLQVQTAEGMNKYSSVFECVKHNYQRGGLRRFYCGLNAKLVRVIPDAAVLFIVYETMKNWLLHIY